MNAPKFQIGQTVFHARRVHGEFTVPCYACGGKKTLTIIFGDGTQAALYCPACENGQDGWDRVSTGTNSISQSTPAAVRTVVTGVEAPRGDPNEFTYQLENAYGVPESEIFATLAEAEQAAEQLARAESDQAQAAFFGKDRGHERQSWAWHAQYYREQINRARKDIAFAEKKLHIAEVRA